MKRLFCVFLIAFALVTLVNSCKKPGTTKQNPPPPGSIVLWNNVHVIDSTQWILYSSDGTIYSYSFTVNTPNIVINVGDIIVGATNGGYIRKVVSYNLNNDRLNLTTSPASMADVFKSGSFTMQLPVYDTNQINQDIVRSYSNVTLYSISGFTTKMLYGQFNVQPSLIASFTYDSTGLINFQMSTTNTDLKDTFAINGLGAEPRVWLNQTNLSSFSSTNIKWIMAYGNILVPVVAKLSLSFNANTSGSSHVSISSTSPGVNVRGYWSSNQAFSAGLQYNGGQWQGIHSSVAYNTITFDTASSLVNSGVKVGSTLQISSLFYNVPGPQITIGFTAGIDQYVNGNYPDFNKNMIAWNTVTDAQLVPPIFGRNINTFSQTWGSDTVSYSTPYLLTLISGSGDTAAIQSILPNPLVVKVTDSKGNPAPNVNVTFAVQGTGGDGTIGGTGATILNVMTNQFGLAQTTWKLGVRQWQGSGPQKVQATVLDGGLNPIGGAPVVFLAYGQ